MKKSKLSIGLMSCLLSVGALAGCDNTVKSSNRGVLLSYNGVEITADAILKDYYDDSSKYQAIYDSIYSIIVKNYFNIEGLSVQNAQYSLVKGSKTEYEKKNITKKLGVADLAKIDTRVEEKITIDRETAETNADSNNTSVKKELQAICQSNGVKYDKNLTALKAKYADDIKKEMFEEDFYTYYVEDLKNGAGTVEDGFTLSDDVKGIWEGYFKSEVPYHVSHILVKLEDSANKYADGEISEANAKKLYDVVNQLGFGTDTFSKIANLNSEDEGSAKLGGDLGIMDTSTGFVNEFKLGVYAYENLYRNKVKSTESVLPEDSHIKMDDEITGNYVSALKTSKEEEIPTVDYSVFEELNEVSELTKANDKEVFSLVYPRNVVYNESLNKHSIRFVTGPQSIVTDGGVEKKYVEDPNGDFIYVDGEFKAHGDESGVKRYTLSDENATTGFYKFEGLDKAILATKVAGEWEPIIAVRAGSDYQGIHFIVVNRSAYLKNDVDANGVTTSDYYTTFYPEQTASYPKYEKGEGVFEGEMNTYVNFSDDGVTKTKARAEEFASKLKSFDSDRLGKYIFKKFQEIEQVKIKDEHLEKALNKWIDTSLEKKVEEREESWKKTWNEYIDALNKQGSERTKLVSNTCKLVFKGVNAGKTLETVLGELGIEDHAADIYAEIKAFYLDKGKKLYGIHDDGTSYLINLITEEDQIKNTDVDKLFYVEGGLCNDGKAHN